MKIIFATGNEDKMREIREILSGLDAQILSMKEAGISPDIEENGATFAENALIKAKAAAAAAEAGAIVLADDSGLEIDFLNGEPGIYSARYLGVHLPYEEKNRVILERLSGVPKEKRGARFVCALAAVFADGQTLVKTGTIEGTIGTEPMGENGFGYDPIFYPDGYSCSTAALAREEKNAISHRGRALRAIRAELEQRMQRSVE